jgi:hypothetical protein
MRDETARGERQAAEARLKPRGPAPAGLPGADRFGIPSHFSLVRGSTPIAECPDLRAHSGRLDSIQEQKNTGVFVSLISYLPTAFSTLFALAAGLLLGFIQ